MTPLFAEGTFDYVSSDKLKETINALLLAWQQPALKSVPEVISIPNTKEFISINIDELTVSVMTDGSIPNTSHLLKTLASNACDGLMITWGDMDVWEVFAQKPASCCGLVGREMVLKAAGPLSDAELMATDKNTWRKLAAIDPTGKTNDKLRSHFISQVLTRAIQSVAEAI